MYTLYRLDAEVVIIKCQHKLICACSYDTVGAHLLRRGDSNSYSKLQQDRCDGSDGGDPRILSWMEDLQSTINTIESRLMSLERSQRQKAELADMRR